MSSFTLTDSFSNSVTINPTFGMVDDTLFSETMVRARSGKSYNYIWGDAHKKYKLPVEYVNSADKSQINSWHKANTLLTLTNNFIEGTLITDTNVASWTLFTGVASIHTINGISAVTFVDSDASGHTLKANASSGGLFNYEKETGWVELSIDIYNTVQTSGYPQIRFSINSPSNSVYATINTNLGKITDVVSLGSGINSFSIGVSTIDPNWSNLRLSMPNTYHDSRVYTLIYAAQTNVLSSSPSVSAALGEITVANYNVRFIHPEKRTIVSIINKLSPIADTIPPYDDQFKGAIELEESN